MTLHPYLKWREKAIDRSEWLDLEWALRAMRVGKDAKVVELGAGSGGLMRYLRAKGWHVIGVDLHGQGEVQRLDLRSHEPPDADAYIFQHLLEHLPQQRARWLLKYCYEKAGKVAGILPAHYNLDTTHVINHYTLKEAYEFIDYVQPKHAVLTADMWSYAMPLDLDYLLIMSKDYIHRFRPRRFNWPYRLLSVYLLRVRR